MNPAIRIGRALVWGRHALSQTSNLALLAIMAGVNFDVVLRYAGGRPVAGMLEGVELLLVFVVFANLAQTQADGGNIAVTVLTRRLKGRGLALLQVVNAALTLVLFAAMTFATAELARRSWQMGEFSAGLVAFPIYPSRIIVSLGCLFLSLHLLGALIEALGRLPRRPEPPR